MCCSWRNEYWSYLDYELLPIKLSEERNRKNCIHRACSLLSVLVVSPAQAWCCRAGRQWLDSLLSIPGPRQNKPPCLLAWNWKPPCQASLVWFWPTTSGKFVWTLEFCLPNLTFDTQKMFYIYLSFNIFFTIIVIFSCFFGGVFGS